MIVDCDMGKRICCLWPRLLVSDVIDVYTIGRRPEVWFAMAFCSDGLGLRGIKKMRDEWTRGKVSRGG